MVNEVVYNYIKKNLGKYKSSQLKPKVLSGGYTQEEFNEALIKIHTEQRENKTKKSFSLLLSFIFVSILMLILIINLFLDFSFDLSILNLFFLSITLLSVFYYFNAYHKIGDLIEDNFIKHSSTFMFISFFLIVALSIFLISPYSGLTNFNFDEENYYLESQNYIIGFPSIVKGLFYLLEFCVVIFLFSYLLLSVGLIRSCKKIKFSIIVGSIRLFFILGLLLIVFSSTFIIINSFNDIIFFTKFVEFIINYDSTIKIVYYVFYSINLLSLILELVMIYFAYNNLYLYDNN